MDEDTGLVQALSPEATVVTRIDPAVSTTTCAAVDVVTAGPSSVEDQDAPTVPDSFPTASLSDSLAVPSTPVLASEPLSPATPPRDRLLASFHSGSPSISILSTKSTPRQLPALPRRLTYTPASTSLYSDWSAESHDKFSPRYTPSEQYMYSTPASRHSPQLSPFRSHRHPSTASPEWYSPQLPGGSPYARSFISYQQHVDSAEIQQTLRRLETKVDHLTKLLETSSNRPASYIPAARQPRTVEMFVPVSNTINSMEEAEDHELLPDNQDGLSKKESLLAIRARASSSMNFAVCLLREFFLPGELKGKNVSGMRGKEQLDPARILKIKNYVYEFYPTPPSERDTVWRECRKAIDSYLRKAFRSS